MISKKSGAFRDAPPTKAPSIFSLANNDFAFLALTLPPYKMQILFAISSSSIFKYIFVSFVFIALILMKDARNTHFSLVY